MMRSFYKRVVNNPKKIIIIFAVIAIFCGLCKGFVKVNYNMRDYLPVGTASTEALDVLDKEFDGEIPNARVMIKDVTIPEALEYKKKLLECEGVLEVTWLDDTTNVYQPIEMMDKAIVDEYYRDNTALFSVVIASESVLEAVDEIRELIGEDNSMSGDAVSTAVATTSTVNEIIIITIIGVIFVLIALIITTKAWIEPLIVLGGLGVAIIINSGSNLIFGEISFVTNAAGSILQLAVSLDYSVFLLHRYEEYIKQYNNPKEAMIEALCKSTSSILSSGVTTVIGFLALIFMKFRLGSDLGIATAKGVAISLITVFIFMPALILMLHRWIDKTMHKGIMPSFDKFGRVVKKTMVPTACLFLLIVIPSYLASSKNTYFFGASHLFGEETQLGQDMKQIEDTFGERDTYVVIIPKGNTATELQLSKSLHSVPCVRDIISYVDTVGAEIPTSYLDETTLAQLMSDNYTRMVITLETEYEGEETFELVEKLRDIIDDYYEEYYLAGEGVSTYDLMDTITEDMFTVNLIAIIAVFITLLITMKSFILPVILVISIETAIWINTAVPYFMDSTVFYLSYLIISTIQLGATVDYAILFTDRYMENRRNMEKKKAIVQTLSSVTVSIMTSASVMAVVGFLMGYVSSHGIISQLGMFIGRGTLLSLGIVLFVLPGLLYLFDGAIRVTSMNTNFIKTIGGRKK